MRTMQERATSQGASTNLLLRAVAILAVITLHVLAILPPETYRSLEYRPFAIAVDQFCRFCVPLFVALSGHGFWQKYRAQTFSYRAFLSKQSAKLLPLYLFASFLFYALFQVVPSWTPTWEVPSLPVQILTGQADYHLYFVPMVFQFYLLFPLLLWLMRRRPWLTLTAALVWQLILYTLMSDLTPIPFVEEHFATDLMQYFWFFSWVFYFVLGMSLEPILHFVQRSRWLVLAVTGTTALGYYLSWNQGMQAMASSVDPIIAMRFTRAPVMLYASGMILTLLITGRWLSQKALSTKTDSSWLLSPLLVLGQHSFTVYLFHTLVLRVVYMVLR